MNAARRHGAAKQEKGATITRWVTVAIVNDEIDAHLKQGMLQEVGVTCVVESSIFRPRSVVPIFSRFKLNVPEEHEALARQALDEMEQTDA